MITAPFRKRRLRRLAAALCFACLLCACSPALPAESSTSDKEAVSMTYDQLTSQQTQWLEDAGLPAESGRTLTSTQKYLLQSAEAAFEYLAGRYPEQTFRLVGYSAIGPTQSQDKLYMIPEGGDPDLDRFTVYVDADGNCTDEYAVVYARAAFVDMAVEPLAQRYGEDNIKAYLTLAATSGLEFDGSAAPLDLLQTGNLVAEGNIIVCAQPGTEEDAWLQDYIAAFAAQGIPAQFSVEFASETGFAGVDQSNQKTFYDSPDMLARYLCTSRTDGSASAEKIG